MIKKNYIISVLIFSVLLTSCGYNKISENKNAIHVQNINIINKNNTTYVLKNAILGISNNNSDNKFIISLKTTEKKFANIKSTSGKITRYTLQISANIILKDVKTSKTTSKSFSRSYNYDVAKSHSDTLSNEKNAYENITEQIKDDMLNYIIFLKN